MATLKNTIINDTGNLRLPAGTTAQRPGTPAVGDMRYNSTTGFAEVYTAGGWGPFGALPPSISSVSPVTFNGEQGTTFTINGANFTSDVIVKFVTNANVEYTAATVTFVNSTQLLVTTPRDFTVAEEPLDVKISQASGIVTSLDVIDCGGSPSWSTAAGTIATVNDRYGSYSPIVTVTATDPDAGATISYSISSGSIPAGTSLNTSTGAISGDPTDVVSQTTSNFDIAATDNAGNTSTRSFSIIVNLAKDGSSSSRAATSAAAIKTLTGTTTTGDYWIQPTGQTAQQVYCDMTTDGGGWTLIAAGRNSNTWWNNAGAGDTTTLVAASTSSYTVRYFSQAWVQALIGGTSWANMTRGIYVRRTELGDSYLISNASGTPTFSWSAWNAAPSSISLTNIRYPNQVLSGSPTYTLTNNSNWTDTLSAGVAGNDATRFFSWTWESHQGQQGISAGVSVTSPGYQAGSEGHAIQQVNIFVK